MNRSNTIATRKTISLYLAFILTTGIIVSIFPSSLFMIGTAQVQPYYDTEMDNRYNSYGSTEYPDYRIYNEIKSYEKDNKNNYYNSYEPTPDYGNDNNYDESQFQSYKLDYYKPNIHYMVEMTIINILKKV